MSTEHQVAEENRRLAIVQAAQRLMAEGHSQGEAAASLGLSPRAAYEAGVAGALCDDATRERLRSIGETFAWDR